MSKQTPFGSITLKIVRCTVYTTKLYATETFNRPSYKIVRPTWLAPPSKCCRPTWRPLPNELWSHHRPCRMKIYRRKAWIAIKEIEKPGSLRERRCFNETVNLASRTRIPRRNPERTLTVEFLPHSAGGLLAKMDSMGAILLMQQVSWRIEVDRLYNSGMRNDPRDKWTQLHAGTEWSFSLQCWNCYITSSVRWCWNLWYVGHCMWTIQSL